jgi:hypothetical protein
MSDRELDPPSGGQQHRKSTAATCTRARSCKMSERRLAHTRSKIFQILQLPFRSANHGELTKSRRRLLIKNMIASSTRIRNRVFVEHHCCKMHRVTFKSTLAIQIVLLNPSNGNASVRSESKVVTTDRQNLRDYPSCHSPERVDRHKTMGHGGLDGVCNSTRASCRKAINSEPPAISTSFPQTPPCLACPPSHSKATVSRAG